MAKLALFEHTETHEVDGVTTVIPGISTPKQFYKAHVFVGHPNSKTAADTFARLHLADKSRYRWNGDPLIINENTGIDPLIETRWEVE